MALVQCAECRRTHSQYAATCPHCGVEAEPMSDAQYAAASTAARSTREKDRSFTKLIIAVVAVLLVLSVVFGPSSATRRAEEERQYRQHVESLSEQQRRRESERFWRGVGLEKSGDRR